MMNKQPSDDRELSFQTSTEAVLDDIEESDSGISDKEATTDKKRRRQEMTEEERREERRTANRRSAFESRHRRKVLIEELQSAVESLSKENSGLRKETESLRAEVNRLTTENRKLGLQQQLSRAIPMSALSDAAGTQRGSNLWNMQQGVQQGMQQGMPQGMQQCMSQSMPQGMPQGMQQVMPQGMQQLQQDMHMNMGMINRFIAGDTNIPPLLGPNAMDRIPTDTTLTDQAREYLRSLQRRQGPT